MSMNGEESVSNGKKRKKRSRGIWPITYKWVAVGTLVAYTAIGSQKVTLAQTQQRPAGNKNAPPPHASRVAHAPF